MDLVETFGSPRPIVGMVHLPALPGAPRYDGDRSAITEAALRDAAALEAGGVDALLVENFGDAPFYPDDVPKHVVASMTAFVDAVRQDTALPVGVNVLRNDAAAAVSVAAATGARFVRVNVHAGARVTDQGLIEGRAHQTMRLRDRLGSDVAVLADVDAKHSAPLAGKDAAPETVPEASERGLADGVIVTGPATGRPVEMDELRAAVSRRDEQSPAVPVFVGSGATPDSIAELLAVADGAIVGSALKAGGVTSNPVDEERVAALVDAAG